MSSHDTSSVSQCSASPDALKMHSQPCCEVHLDLAESKSINVKAVQESALVQLTAEQKIQENFICIVHGCHYRSESCPMSGRPLSAAGLRSSASSCAASPTAAAVDLLTHLDIDNREDANELMSFMLLNAPSTVSSLPSLPATRVMPCQQGVGAQGASLFLSPSMPVRTGGGVLLFHRGGELGGLGGLKSALPPRQAQGGGAQAQLAFYPRQQALLSSALSLTRPQVSAVLWADWHISTFLCGRQKSLLLALWCSIPREGIHRCQEIPSQGWDIQCTRRLSQVTPHSQSGTLHP
jgi:hypothetical protein